MMRLASSKATWLVFGFPLVLLFIIGAIADRTTNSFAQSEFWVSHTHEVQTVLESLRADVFMAQDARKGYLLTGDEASLVNYSAAAQQLPHLLAKIRELTADNPHQQLRIDLLQGVVQRKMVALNSSIDLKRTPDSKITTAESAVKQAEISTENEDLNAQLIVLLKAMDTEESGLLAKRILVSSDSYRRMRGVLVISFIAVLLFLLMTFGRLLVELRNRMRAESAVRRLSGRILQLQDMERRKVARELHDGVGQYFASSKMTVDSVLHGGSLSEAQRNALVEAVELLEQGIAEARTLSHLLHPPLLDEVGFRAAAEWYISGFSDRSKIKVQLMAPEALESMSKDIELVLFRVLQEALTNIHRHAASATAEVRIYCASGRVTMEIEDRGKGISRSLLEDFKRSTGTGVGLAGMRERVGEFQGMLYLKSEGRGTLLIVEMPLPLLEEIDTTPLGPPGIHSPARSSGSEVRGGGDQLLLAATRL